MPIYEYGCSGCSGHFEYTQRMSDDPLTTCEKCGGELKRLISRTAFHLKGSGWYKDLYSSAKPDAKAADAGTSDSKAASSSESDSGGSTDSSSTAKEPASSTPSAPASGGSTEKD